jgi:hypothetical protein
MSTQSIKRKLRNPIHNPVDWAYDTLTKLKKKKWEEVYNSTDEQQGVIHEYYGQPGIFYQTYGKGGKGGWGGYWQREGVTSVWKVEGSTFKYMNNKTIEYQPQNSMVGQSAQIRIVHK